jgi:hypothetical protein
MAGWRLFCVSVCCSGVLVAAACSRGDRGTDSATPMPTPSASASASGSGSGSGSGPTTMTATDASASAEAPRPSSVAAAAPVSDPLLTAPPIKARSIGHTSFVLKVTLEGGAAAAYKPRSRKRLGDRRYRAEIAAYRLARALGIDNVPRAEPRAFQASALRAACSVGGAADDFDQLALSDADGSVRGAITPWIEKYEVLPLEQPAWRAKWTAWLTDATSDVPGDQHAIARSVSTMIAFDYVTANWDRWSGANIARDGATGNVLFVDNDGAFYEAPPADSLARQLALLKRVVRFSRSFVGALRALDAEKLRGVIGDESPGVPLLSDALVTAADQRRRRAVEVIDAKGDAALAFE